MIRTPAHIAGLLNMLWTVPDASQLLSSD